MRLFTIHQAKVNAMLEALRYTKGNKLLAASILGISVKCLRYFVRREDELKNFRVSAAKYQPKLRHERMTREGDE